MWATGFVVQPEAIAESENASVSLAWMRKVTLTHGCAICGSLAVKTVDGTFRNRHYFVTPNSVSFYDKRHLFSYGHEDVHYTRGEQPVIVNWQGFRILLQTCYDLRFPVFSRYGRAGEYDAIIYVANWPEKRQMAWETLLRARAIENMCYVMAVNRIGQDTKCKYTGGSAIIDPLGKTINGLSSDLSLEELRLTRNRFRFLDDRD
jgi:predicted amidohydrolase